MPGIIKTCESTSIFSIRSLCFKLFLVPNSWLLGVSQRQLQSLLKDSKISTNKRMQTGHPLATRVKPPLMQCVRH